MLQLLYVSTWERNDRMKNRNTTAETAPKFNSKIVETEAEIDTLSMHTYMTDHFLDLVQAFQ